MSKGLREEEPSSASATTTSSIVAMIPPAEVMAGRTVSELLETSQFLSECDMNTTSELQEQLSDEGEQEDHHHSVALSEYTALLQHYDESSDNEHTREQELLVEPPIYAADVVSFPPHHRMMTFQSGPARRTRSQTSIMSQAGPAQQQVTVTPHDSTASSMASSSPIAAATNTNTTTADFTKHDVILGRGGKSNNHPGNQLYLRDKELLQERYFRVSKREKTAIAQELVDRVHARGGRFMKEMTTVESSTNDNDNDDDNVHLSSSITTTTWTEITNEDARRKASQSLREVSTKESRSRKREKYRKHPPQRRPQPKQRPSSPA